MRQQITSRPLRGMPSVITTFTIVTTAVASISEALIPSGASGVLIGNDGGDIHWLIGTDPTTEVGITLRQYEELLIRDTVDDIKAIRFIRLTGTDGKLQFQFYTE